MFDGGFPMVIEHGSDSIAVEVFKIPDKPDNMDILEGHPQHFERKITKVYVNGALEDAWMYLYQYRVNDKDYLPAGKWPSNGRDNDNS